MGRLGKTDAMERRGIIVKLKRIRKQMAATMTVEDGKSENQSISVKSNARNPEKRYTIIQLSCG